MTRLFLAAGVAALAITSAADAKPGGNGGGHGNGGGQQAQQQRGGGGGHGGGGGGGGRPEFQGFRGGGGGGGHGGGSFQAFRGGGRGHGGGFAAPRMEQRGFAQQRFERPQRMERQQFRVERQAQNRGFERQQMRVQRQAQNRNFERQQMRVQRQAQNHAFERQQMRVERQAQNRGLERQQLRAQRMEQARGGDFGRRQMEQQQQAFARQQFDRNRVQAQTAFANRNGDERFRVNEEFANNYYGNRNGRGLIDGCPPGLWAKNNGCMPPGQAAKLFGAPLAAAASFAPLYALPASASYLYPDTPDYYYRYGDGYLYQVDRGTNVIANLLPLLAGGYMPGQYLPQPYMASYVPDYYGLNSFYPDYGNTCNRYANGVVYEVDCYSGMVQDVVPLYAGGYGVGQMLPSSYAYYNVPYQYRDVYYDTPNYNYWYAPGAIYQYDPHSSMITSVAALLSPGFTVGQPLPVGYDVYNVPYDYRATYYDTPNAWYRYNNGYIYQVDPVTRLVTAIVASILT